MKNFQRDSRPGGWKGSNKFGGKKPWERQASDRDGDRPMLHKAVCNACGQSCEVPFRPNGRKPVFCRECFVKPEGKTSYTSAPRSTEDYKDHFRMINKKLDTILKLLSPVPSVQALSQDDDTDVFTFEMAKETAKKGRAKKRTV
ncbi:hypothetical protein HZA87_05470 [Candidatus Uhrbacteria bacterium]|nr:hypothetical protein [Candidatus Uhrbacteria bacterium]